MRVVFVAFHKGHEPGDQADLPEAIAKALIDNAVAVIDPAAVEPEPAPEPKRGRK